MPELTGNALDRIQNDIELKPVPGWGLPTEMRAFLRWLADHVEGRSDAARMAEFETYDVFADMPATLRDDLRREGLLD